MSRILHFALLILPLLALHAPTAQAASLQLYGHWCGPGNSINTAPPTDLLDGACMRHDMCSVANGMGACGCDITFMRELRGLPYPNGTIQVAGRAMYDGIAMSPCNDPNGWAYKQSMMWNDIAADVVSGRATPFDVPARWMYLLSRSTPYN